MRALSTFPGYQRPSSGSLTLLHNSVEWVGYVGARGWKRLCIYSMSGLFTSKKARKRSSSSASTASAFTVTGLSLCSLWCAVFPATTANCLQDGTLFSTFRSPWHFLCLSSGQLKQCCTGHYHLTYRQCCALWEDLDYARHPGFLIGKDSDRLVNSGIVSVVLGVEQHRFCAFLSLLL